MGSMNRRIRRLEERMDPSGALADPDAEERRRARVLAELREFEAWRRSMTNEEHEEWKQSPEGQEFKRELEEHLERRRRGGA